MNHYEIRPHHCFNKWVLVFRNGISLRAFTNRTEAQSFIDRQRNLENLKGREIIL